VGEIFPDRQGHRGIGMQSLEVHPDVHADDAPLPEDPLAGGDAVDDLLVDRGAECLGEAVEALERWLGARVPTDEGLGFAVEILRRHAGLDDATHQGMHAGDDRPGAPHDLQFPCRLEGHHRYQPTMARTRSLMRSTGPVAEIRRTRPCLSYQASTGAVCSR
jgi:hypothetical protein